MGIYYEKERESLRQRYDWPEAEDSKTYGNKLVSYGHIKTDKADRREEGEKSVRFNVGYLR